MTIPSHDQFIDRFHDTAWLDAGRRIFSENGLAVADITRSEQGESVVLLGDGRYVLKIYRPWKRGYERESAALERLSGALPVEIPEIVARGEFEKYKYLITTAIGGRSLSRKEWLALDTAVQAGTVDQLAAIFRALHGLRIPGLEFDWPAFIAANAANAVVRQQSEGGNPEWVKSLPEYIERNFPLVPAEGPFPFLHADIHFGNIRLRDAGGRLRISGVFDFADSLRGCPEYDFLAPGVLMLQGQGEMQRRLFRAYGYADAEINEEMRRRMMMLTILYEWSSLRRYAERLSPEAVNFSLNELERAIWPFA